MKHFGSVLDFTHHRNDAIIRACRQCILNAPTILMPDIFRNAAKLPAPRFWVSEERATIVISRMIAGKPLSNMRPNKLEMFREIYRRYLLARQAGPDRDTFDIVSDIVNQPAPQFYLTPRTIGEIFYRIKRAARTAKAACH